MKKKIAVFCSALMGPSKCGGTGVIHLSTAELLNDAGHSVTIYLKKGLVSQAGFQQWRHIFSKKGIRLELIPEPSGELELSPEGKLSYAIFELLKRVHYDVVHFIEHLGLGYYAMLAKKGGLAFEDTLFFVTIAGSYYWHVRENLQPYFPHVSALQNHFMERGSAELADVVYSPTQYALQWGRDRGWNFPKRVVTLPYPLNLRSLTYLGRRDHIDEIVFFGRLETRKGLEIFCQAVERLPSSLLKGKTVTFLGQCGFAANEYPAGQFLKDHSKKWKFRWKLIHDYTQSQAIDYLRTRNVLAVIASRSETFGYTVAECATVGIPFICSAIAPFLEILSVKSRQGVLFDGTVSGLVEKLSHVLTEGQAQLPRLAFDYDSVHQQWKQLHEEVELKKLRRTRTSRKRAAKIKKISLCIIHKDRLPYLKQCLKGFKRQTRQPDEIIIVDNGSKIPPIASDLGKKIKIIRLLRSKPVSEARNLAARKASGDILLFFDDDDFPKSNQIEAMAKALVLNRADIVTCGFERFSGKGLPNTKKLGSKWIPLGSSIDCGLFYNAFGPMPAMIRKKEFFRIGGLKPEPTGAGEEDVEFFARAALKGHSLVALPEALFWYRMHPENRSRELNYMDSSHHRLSAYFGPAMEPLAHFIASFHYRSENPARVYPHLRNHQMRFSRRSFGKLLYTSNNRKVSAAHVGSSSEKQFKAESIQEKILRFPRLQLTGMRRVMAEINTLGSGEAWIELRCKAKVADGSVRWVKCAKMLPENLQTVQFVLDAIEFSENPEIIVTGPGWRIFRSIRIFGEAG